MIRLVKGISSGTTALLHRGPLPAGVSPAALLDPVRGMGGDLLVIVGQDVRAHTLAGEVSVPSAALRLAAAMRLADGEAARTVQLTAHGRTAEVAVEAGAFAIDHGAWQISGGVHAHAAGHDRMVSLSGIEGKRPGLGIEIGGRSVAVVALTSAEELGALDLTTAPIQEQAEGAAPEITAAHVVCAVVILGERSVDLTDAAGAVVGTQTIGAAQVRAYDTAAGEVYSSDTAAIGAAAAARAWLGEESAREWVVVFGAGTTQVVLGEHAIASAPAELFATIDFRPEG